MSGHATADVSLPSFRSALSLIELLTTVTVVVALVGLLLPANRKTPNAIDPPGKDESTVNGRVKVLIEILSDPEANGEKLGETRYAIAELVKIGRPAVPQLVKVVAESDPKDAGTVRGNGPAYSALALDEIGKPAVETVLREWGRLDDPARWKLMRFRGKHDYAASLDFALVSLDSMSNDIFAQAVRYFGQHKEAKARDPLLKKLNTAAPRVRWDVLDALTQIGGEGVPESLIELLKKDSWAAKGEGLIPPPGSPPPWWPDGRPRVIEALRKLKAEKAGPALLAVLQERGPGKAYLGSFIIPFLAEYGGPDCVDELKQIAATKDEDIVRSLDRPERIRSMASDAAKAIAARARK